MRASFNWIREFCDPGMAADEVARRLTAAGFEVERIDDPAAGLDGVVAARVRSVEPHPQAAGRFVYELDAGEAAPHVRVVAGTNNAVPGEYVALARPGARLPGRDEPIRASDVRGVQSEGMLAAADELGLDGWDPPGTRGLLVLNGTASEGAPIRRALFRDDRVLEINVTPNRPDALGHVGLAREVAAATRAPFKPLDPKLREAGAAAATLAKVEIDDAGGCPRYVGRVVEDVSVRPSPAWVRLRLVLCGVRAISNAVDVTNYVQLELGHPIHGFDLDRLAGGGVVVRRARAGEKMMFLDGVERVIDAEDLVIAEAGEDGLGKGGRAVALAGVMGGEGSGIAAGTRRVLVESAFFEPSRIRRAARRYAMHTESSHRFERGADVDAAPLAAARAAALLAELAGGVVRPGAIDRYPRPRKRRVVAFRPARATRILGHEVPRSSWEAGLAALGFEKVSESADTGGARIEYAVPHARVDVSREEDLVEEVARTYGYDRFPETLPGGGALPPPQALPLPHPGRDAAEAVARRTLCGAGWNEAISLAYASPRDIEALGLAPDDPIAKPVALANPLGEEQSLMRTTLLPGLLRAIERNQRQGIDDVRLFEIGASFFKRAGGGGAAAPDDPARGPLDERLMLCGVATGRRYPEHWSAPADEVDFHDAAGAVAAVFDALGQPRPAFGRPPGAPYHPLKSALAKLESAHVGMVGTLHPEIVAAFGIDGEVQAFELDLGFLAAQGLPTPRFAELPRFPSVERDLALVVDLDVTAARIRTEIEAATAAAAGTDGPQLVAADVFDVYRGKGIPEGKVSLAWRLTFRHPARTLTDDEVAAAMAAVVARLGTSIKAVVRA